MRKMRKKARVTAAVETAMIVSPALQQAVPVVSVECATSGEDDETEEREDDTKKSVTTACTQENNASDLSDDEDVELVGKKSAVAENKDRTKDHRSSPADTSSRSKSEGSQMSEELTLLDSVESPDEEDLSTLSRDPGLTDLDAERRSGLKMSVANDRLESSTDDDLCTDERLQMSESDYEIGLTYQAVLGEIGLTDPAVPDPVLHVAEPDRNESDKSSENGFQLARCDKDSTDTKNMEFQQLERVSFDLVGEESLREYFGKKPVLGLRETERDVRLDLSELGEKVGRTETNNGPKSGDFVGDVCATTDRVGVFDLPEAKSRLVLSENCVSLDQMTRDDHLDLTEPTDGSNDLPLTQPGIQSNIAGRTSDEFIEEPREEKIVAGHNSADDIVSDRSEAAAFDFEIVTRSDVEMIKSSMNEIHSELGNDGSASEFPKTEKPTPSSFHVQPKPSQCLPRTENPALNDSAQKFSELSSECESMIFDTRDLDTCSMATRFSETSNVNIFPVTPSNISLRLTASSHIAGAINNSSVVDVSRTRNLDGIAPTAELDSFSENDEDISASLSATSVPPGIFGAASSAGARLNEAVQPGDASLPCVLPSADSFDSSLVDFNLRHLESSSREFSDIVVAATTQKSDPVQIFPLAAQDSGTIFISSDSTLVAVGTLDSTVVAIENFSATAHEETIEVIRDTAADLKCVPTEIATSGYRLEQAPVCGENVQVLTAESSVNMRSSGDGDRTLNRVGVSESEDDANGKNTGSESTTSNSTISASTVDTSKRNKGAAVTGSADEHVKSSVIDRAVCVVVPLKEKAIFSEPGGGRRQKGGSHESPRLKSANKHCTASSPGKTASPEKTASPGKTAPPGKSPKDLDPITRMDLLLESLSSNRNTPPSGGGGARVTPMSPLRAVKLASPLVHGEADRSTIPVASVMGRRTLGFSSVGKERPSSLVLNAAEVGCQQAESSSGDNDYHDVSTHASHVDDDAGKYLCPRGPGAAILKDSSSDSFVVSTTTSGSVDFSLGADTTETSSRGGGGGAYGLYVSPQEEQSVSSGLQGFSIAMTTTDDTSSLDRLGSDLLSLDNLDGVDLGSEGEELNTTEGDDLGDDVEVEIWPRVLLNKNIIDRNFAVAAAKASAQINVNDEAAVDAGLSNKENTASINISANNSTLIAPNASKLDVNTSLAVLKDTRKDKKQTEAGGDNKAKPTTDSSSNGSVGRVATRPSTSVVSPNRLIDAKRRFFHEAAQPVRIDPRSIFQDMPTTSARQPVVAMEIDASVASGMGGLKPLDRAKKNASPGATFVPDVVDLSQSPGVRRRLLPPTPVESSVDEPLAMVINETSEPTEMTRQISNVPTLNAVRTETRSLTETALDGAGGGVGVADVVGSESWPLMRPKKKQSTAGEKSRPSSAFVTTEQGSAVVGGVGAQAKGGIDGVGLARPTTSRPESRPLSKAMSRTKHTPLLVYLNYHSVF